MPYYRVITSGFDMDGQLTVTETRDQLKNQYTFDHRIPLYSADPPANATLEQLSTHRGKLELRHEAIEQAGCKRDDRTKTEMRVYSCHPVETVR